MNGLTKWFGCKALLAGSASVVVLAAAPVCAHAQVRAFDIPAQPLSSALLTFSRQSDEMVVASPDVTSGKRSHEVRGLLTPQEAIGRLLAGSGLRAQVAQQGGYLIEKATLRSNTSYAQEARPAGVGAGSGPAQSQDDEQQAGEGIDDIVVTAQRQEQLAIRRRCRSRRWMTAP